MNYLFDEYGRYAGTSEAETDRSTPVEPAELTAAYNWNGVNWVYAPHIQLTPIVMQQSSTPVVTVISHLAFMDRLTDAEFAGILLAAKESVEVEVWLKKFDAAGEIDLADERTIAGVHALESAGLLGEGRAVEILAWPE
jgi:hypothetical protein